MFAKNYFFSLLMLPLLFLSCNKDEYPDGGRHAKAQENMVSNWTLKQFTVEGADSLPLVDPRFRETGALRISVVHTSSGIALSTPPRILKAGYPLVLFQTSVQLVDHDNKLKFILGDNTAYSHYPFIMGDSE